MIYINQSINLYLAAHLSISSRQKKVFIALSSVRGKQAMRVQLLKNQCRQASSWTSRFPMFCYPLTDHLMPADASAPLNKRTAPSFFKLFLSSLPLSKKWNFAVANVLFFLPIPQLWSPNYCGVVALAVFFLSCCSSFEVFHIIIVVERWRRWCECWWCRLPDCHPTSSLQGSKARALFTDGKRFWKKLMQRTVNTKTHMMTNTNDVCSLQKGEKGVTKPW